MARRGLRSILIFVLAATACSDDVKQAPDHFIADAGPDSPRPDGPRPDQAAPHKALALKVVHLNDTHAQVEPSNVSLSFKNDQGKDEKTTVQAGGFTRLVAKVKKVRAASKNTLVLHAGDAFQGTLFFTKYQGLADVEFLNMMPLDAMTLGNHEFDKGTNALAGFIKAAKFPVLGGNVDASKDANLKGLTKRYTISTVDGEQVGIIGLTTADTPTISSPGSDVAFGDAVQAAKELVKELAGKGVNKVVVLSHLGFDADEALAKAVDGVDVVVGGHSHTFAGDKAAFGGFGLSPAREYPVSVKTPSGKTACVVSSWEKGKVLGTLDVELDRDGYVTKCGGGTLMVVSDLFKQYSSTTKKDEEVDALRKTLFAGQVKASTVLEIVDEDADAKSKLAGYLPPIEALRKQEIADVVDDLWHVRVPGTKHAASGEAMPKGSYIAPHVAEALLWKGKQLSPPAQLALVTGGGVRIDIPKGKLTVAQVYELQPFGNTLYLLKVTGKELKDSIEAAVASATASGSSGGPFPYVAGARYTADLTKAAGQQISALEVLDASSQWKACDPAATYTLALQNFNATGGDGYNVFKAVTAYRNDTGFIDAEVFMDYATAKKQLSRMPADTGVTFIPKP